VRVLLKLGLLCVESSEGRCFSIGLADGKRVSREWNFDRDGKHRERHVESCWLPTKSVKSKADKVTSSNVE